MSKASKDFLKVMLTFFPSKIVEYKKIIKNYDEELETVIIEDIFMPEIINLLKEDKNKNLLKKIFDYFEKILFCEDEYLVNILSITVLEILGNDRAVLEVAKKYMGPKTIQFQEEADRELGRIK